jgi:uncharacterized protein (TIGR03435 family)
MAAFRGMSLRFARVALLCAIYPIAIRSSALAQTASPTAADAAITPPAYDVITIKPNKTASGSVDIDTEDDHYSATNVSLKNLLENVYDIKEDLISGVPGPLESARFDIQAKISDPDPVALKKITPEQERLKLLPLLTERFQLKTHTETKILPVYELVVIPGGPKFKPSADQTKTGGGSTSIQGSRVHGKLTAHDIPMSSLAKSLAGQVHRTVIDKTGLAGNFDLALQWSTDEATDAGADADPTIFTAVQEQLGLKLQPAKGPVETLVVDQAAMPSEN